MNRLIVSLCFCLLANVLAAQNNLSLDKLSDEHPRYLTDKSGLKDMQRMIEHINVIYGKWNQIGNSFIKNCL